MAPPMRMIISKPMLASLFPGDLMARGEVLEEKPCGLIGQRIEEADAIGGTEGLKVQAHGDFFSMMSWRTTESGRSRSEIIRSICAGKMRPRFLA